MPYIHMSTTKTLSKSKKEELANGIMQCVKLLPGKPAERAMVRIDENCEIYRGGEITECAFLQTLFQRPIEMDDQKAYIEALYALFKKVLDLDTPQVYFAMVDLDTWGSRGTLH